MAAKMQYLDELRSDLRAKIEKFLEEHPSAVVVEVDKHNYVDKFLDGSIEHKFQSIECRLLDKDGKKSDYYMHNEHYDSYKAYCSCHLDIEKIEIYEKKDSNPEDKRHFIFSLLKRNSYNCPKDILHGERLSAEMCGIEIPDSYDTVSELVDRFRNAIKKE